jgi:ubiquitin-protein ligase
MSEGQHAEPVSIIEANDQSQILEKELCNDMPHNHIHTKKTLLGSIMSFQCFSLSFEIRMLPEYPQIPPRLVCTSNLDFPSVADGRDLLPLVLEWSSSSTCKDVILATPKFLEQNKLQEDIGEFYLLDPVDLSFYTDKPGMLWCYCVEVDPLNENVTRSRALIITHSYFIILEPSKSWTNWGYIVFWASLSGLQSIQKSKHHDDRILLEWHESIGAKFQILRTNQAKSIISLICENANKLGSIVQKSYRLDIEENSDKFKVYDILRKIERNERLIETLVDDEKINGLIALYQKAVEHFSGMNDIRYEIYLNKLHGLFTDERVMKIMCSEIKPVQGRKNRVKSMELLGVKEDFSNIKRRSMGFY